MLVSRAATEADFAGADLVVVSPGVPAFPRARRAGEASGARGDR